MPSMEDALIARLQADCTALEAAERTVRADVGAPLKEAERARAFVRRQLSALGDMPRIAAPEPERETAVERPLVALFRDELGESARLLLDWLLISRTEASLSCVVLGRGGETLSYAAAACKLGCGRFLDRTGRHLRIDEVAR